MRKLTDQQKIEIVEKSLLGFSSRKLAEEYKVTHTSILSILRVRGIKYEKWNLWLYL